MKRRDFLITAGGAAITGFASGRPLSAQAAKQVKQSTLDRLAIMTLNFQRILKVPDVPDGPDRTLEIFDIGQMLADKYGVHKVEFQHYHIASTEPSFLKELRSRIERSKSRITQINVEFNTLTISAPQLRERLMAIDLTKMWVDHAVTLGAQRVMINQGAPTHENKVYAIPALKAMADYGKSRNIIVSVETRMAFGGARGAAPGAGRGAGAGVAAPSPSPQPAPAPAAPQATPAVAAAPAPPPTPRPEVWALLAEIIRGGGAYSNVDVGGAGAASQEELHQCLKMLFPMSAGTLHTRVGTRWALATAIRFLESDLGYRGLYTIEAANGHEGTQEIYDVVVNTL